MTTARHSADIFDPATIAIDDAPTATERAILRLFRRMTKEQQTAFVWAMNAATRRIAVTREEIKIGRGINA